MNVAKQKEAITTGLETITPAEAKWLLQNNNRNRLIKRRLVDLLVRDIKSGDFIVTHQGIAIDNAGNLLDGQHRLTAVAEAGKNVQMYVTRGLDPETMNVVDVGAKRSQADVLAIHGYMNTTALAASAMIYDSYLKGELSSSRNHDRRINNFELLKFIDRHLELGQAIHWTLGNKRLRMLGSSSVVAAFYAIFHRKNKAKAAEFFRVLVENFSEKKNHPAMVLMEHILRRKANNIRVTRAYLMAAFIRSWTNFLANEFTNNIVIKDAHQVIKDFEQPS